MGIGVVQRVIQDEHNCSLHHIVDLGGARAADFQRAGAGRVGDRQARHRIVRCLLKIARQR